MSNLFQYTRLSVAHTCYLAGNAFGNISSEGINAFFDILKMKKITVIKIHTMCFISIYYDC